MPESGISRGLTTEGAYSTRVAQLGRGVTGNSGIFSTNGPLTAIVFRVNVTAATGTTPTLVIKLQDTFDNTNWQDVTGVTTASLTTTGITVVRFDLRALPITDRVRFFWTIGGTTPNFNFAVDTYEIRA